MNGTDGIVNAGGLARFCRIWDGSSDPEIRAGDDEVSGLSTLFEPLCIYLPVSKVLELGIGRKDSGMHPPISTENTVLPRVIFA